jgi:hypothetical protein
VGSQFHHGPCFRKPPCDPGQSDFPNPVLASAPPSFSGCRPSQVFCGSNAGSSTPSVTWSADILVLIVPTGLVRLCVRGLGTASGPPSARSPFAWRRRCLRQDDLAGHLGGRYSSVVTHTGSCARPYPSPRLGAWPLVRRVLAGCRAVPAGTWPFPTLSLQSLRRCLDPYPAVSPRATRPLPPRKHRPHDTGKSVRHTGLSLHCGFRREPYFGAAVIRLPSGSYAC